MSPSDSGTQRRRKDSIGSFVAAGPRFWAAMAALPPYFLIRGLAYKAALTALFAVLAVGAGKRIRWGYFLILIASIAFFHLLAPMGRVLAEIGPLTVTAGALESGVTRGVSLVGMVFLSVAAVRPELELPGRLGGLLGRTFYHFEAILEGRGAIDRKDFFGSLDRLLMERLNPNADAAGPAGAGGEEHAPGTAPARTEAASPVRGWPLAAAFAASVWGLWAASLLLPAA